MPIETSTSDSSHKHFQISQVIPSPSKSELTGQPAQISSMERQPDKTSRLIDERGNVVTTKQQYIVTKQGEQVRSFSADGTQQYSGRATTTMRINPRSVDRMIVTRVIQSPSGDETLV